MLTVGSLFSGIGGFDLGLERAGMRCLWQCEIDPYCQRVLEKHWPDVLRVPDIRDVGAEHRPRVDSSAAASPAKTSAYAGHGAGIDGARSGLWAEMLRVIRELRPRYVVVENVAALLARGLDAFSETWPRCGYDAEWDCIPASAVGAPHRRDRVWLVAYANVESARRAREGFDRAGWRSGFSKRRLGAGRHPMRAWRTTARRSSRGSRGAEGEGQAPQRQRLRDALVDRSEDLPDADDAGRSEQRRPESSGAEQPAPELGGRWSPEPAVGRVVDGFPGRVDQLRALGNALVPQIAEWIGRRIIDYEEGRLAA